MEKLPIVKIAFNAGAEEQLEKEIQKYTKKFGDIGYIVLPQSTFSNKTYVDQYFRIMEYQKIDSADLIFVIMKDTKVITTDLRLQINYALENRKEIWYSEPFRVPRVYTICGSMKYIESMKHIARNMTLAGNIVFLPNTADIFPSDLSNNELSHLHEDHYYKMKLADDILIFDQDNYIGPDTKREIDYAKLNGMNLIYYSNWEERENYQ